MGFGLGGIGYLNTFFEKAAQHSTEVMTAEISRLRDEAEHQKKTE